MKYYFYYLIIINTFSLIYYAIDKKLSKKHKYRISENWLFLISIIGGSLGAILGMLIFKHKTRKIKFYLINYTSLAIWLYVSILFIIK